MNEEDIGKVDYIPIKVRIEDLEEADPNEHNDDPDTDHRKLIDKRDD